jgi:hypothetical protein
MVSEEKVKEYTLDEVEKHNTDQSLWVIIGNEDNGACPQFFSSVFVPEGGALHTRIYAWSISPCPLLQRRWLRQGTVLCSALFWLLPLASFFRFLFSHATFLFSLRP